MKYLYFISFGLFIFDRIIKYFAPSINFGGNFLSFGFYKNYAGAFSLPIAGWLYNMAGIILLAIFIYLFLKEHKNVYSLQLTAYSFIILGGVSNIFDRLFYGYTIDYINFFNFSFFNLADIMLIAGIILLLIQNLKIRNSLKIDN